MHDGYNVNPGASALWLKRFAEYDKPLGVPDGPAVKSGYTYTREFEHASIWLNLEQGKGRIIWDADSIPYQPVQYTVQFIVQEINSLACISDALIEMDSLVKQTNVAGVQYFTLDNGHYQYTISKTGFFTMDSSIQVYTDTIIYIRMQPTTAYVKFRVKEDSNPVVYSVISLNSDTLKTNSVGLAVYENLPVYENYSYSIGKTGYKTVSGNFWLEKDTTIDIEINALTVVNTYNEGTLRIFPIPARNYIMIESESDLHKIELLDLEGRMLLSENVDGRIIRQELYDGFPQIYLLNVIFKDGSSVIKKFVKF